MTGQYVIARKTVQGVWQLLHRAFPSYTLPPDLAMMPLPAVSKYYWLQHPHFESGRISLAEFKTMKEALLELKTNIEGGNEVVQIGNEIHFIYIFNDFLDRHSYTIFKKEREQ